MLLNSTGAPSNSSKPVEKCVICQDPLIQHVASVSGCSHKFHKDCIESWKNITNSCPVCRKRFDYIEHGHTKYKVQQKDQKNEDELTNEYLNGLANEPCQICDSTEFADMALLCDGCDKCYHTHCLGIDAIPDGDWYCDTCKHLEPHRNRTLLRRRSRINDRVLISRNENNPEWIMTQDEDYIPSERDTEDDDVDIGNISSDNNEENDELKEGMLSVHQYDGNRRNKRRKRKRFEIESDDESENDLLRLKLDNNHNKRRKITQCDNKQKDKTWICSLCTFTNDWKRDECEMCITKRDNKKKKKEELSIDDYFNNSQNTNTKKKKYSRRNPYRKRERNMNTNLRTRGDIINGSQRDNKRSVDCIVGNDIMSRFDLNETDDLLSMAEDISKTNGNGYKRKDNNKNKNKSKEEIQDFDIDFKFKAKPKMKYRDRRKLTLNSHC